VSTDFNLSQKLGAVQAKPRLIRSILRPMGQATTGVCRVAALVLCAGLGVWTSTRPVDTHPDPTRPSRPPRMPRG
jgi:hypothetical protein